MEPVKSSLLAALFLKKYFLFCIGVQLINKQCWTFHVDSKGAQSQGYMYPFSLKLPSHPQCTNLDINKCIQPGNHCHNQDTDCFYQLEGISCDPLQSIPTSDPGHRPPPKVLSAFSRISTKFNFLEFLVSYPWNYTRCTPVCRFFLFFHAHS